jgi:hypothetical protein
MAVTISIKIGNIIGNENISQLKKYQSFSVMIKKDDILQTYTKKLFNR